MPRRARGGVQSEGGLALMMTIVTHVTLKQGTEPAWDAAMRDRLEAARQQPGFRGAQLMMPLDRLDKRIIIGTWETRAAWEAWHADAAFAETRARLEGSEAQPSEHWWHEVLVEVEP
jgi:heme-degrading monooxygenase HmoA